MAKRKDFKILANINNIPIEEAELVYLEPGNRLGPNNRYEIIKLIGTGTIGAVYLAIDYEEKQSLLALKMILPHLLEDEAKLDSFIENITELQYLNHSSVAVIYDFWKQNILYFYTMEHIEGPTLEEWMAQRQQQGEAISPQQAHKIIDQICSGLAVLHNTGGHCLLHANNILVAKDEKSEQIEVKICDFGLYHLQPGSFWWQASCHFDSQSYFAPEMQETGDSLTGQSDIFSLAVLLYRLLTWHNPSPEYRSLKSLRSGLPEALDDVLQKALQPKPESRHSDVQSFAQHLAIVLEDVDSSVTGRLTRTASIPKALVPTKKQSLAERLAATRLKFAKAKKATRKYSKPDAVNSTDIAMPAALPEAANAADVEMEPVPAEVEANAETEPVTAKAENVEMVIDAAPICTAADEKTTVDDSETAPVDHTLIATEEEVAAGTTVMEITGTEEDDQSWLKQANAQILAKRYDSAIELLEKALVIKRTAATVDLLERLRSYQQQAAQLKKKAEQSNNPYQKLQLLRQAEKISPHYRGLHEQIVPLQQQLDRQEVRAEQILETGDHLVAEGKYEEAILTWKKMAGPTRRQKEIEDRIMQVVDMMAEEASQMITDGKPYEARRTLAKISKFSDDPLIDELEEEISLNIQQRESRFKQALKEGQKHFVKKQYAAAAEVWQQTIGITENDYLLLEKIAKAKQLDQAMHGDEKDYLELVTMARTLEKREDYQGALQALERIKRRNWLCPVSDIRPDIERVSKLAAAQSYSQQALDLLAMISQHLSQGKLTEAGAILNEPVLRRKLIPSVAKRHQSVLEQFEKKRKARKKFLQRLLLAGGIVVLLALVAAIWLIML